MRAAYARARARSNTTFLVQTAGLARGYLPSAMTAAALTPEELDMSNATVTDDARWWFDGLAVIKAGAGDTNGQLTVVEVTEPPDAQAPLHVHHREDEAFY